MSLFITQGFHPLLGRLKKKYWGHKLRVYPLLQAPLHHWIIQTFGSKTPSVLDYVKLTSKLQVWMLREERFPQISAHNTDVMPKRLDAHYYDTNLSDSTHCGHSRYCRMRASWTQAWPFFPMPLNSPSTLLKY